MSKLVWQIIKYGVIGALATAIHLVVSGLASAWLLPCLGAGDPLVKYCGFSPAEIGDVVRASRAAICGLIGFVVANIVCWLLNRRYVFTPGRHVWYVEYLLFMAGSGLSVLLGTVAIWVLVYFAGYETTYSFVVNVAISVALNFVIRKFFVFKG